MKLAVKNIYGVKVCTELWSPKKRRQYFCFLALEMFEEACHCLVASNMEKQADELADKCLEKDFSDSRKSKFWCIKGDIHNSEEYYEKAWELSNERNARAMRSLGALLIHRKRYDAAADAFQKGKKNHIVFKTFLDK